MCKWRTTTVLSVPVSIPSESSDAEKIEWKDVPIDSCIVPLIKIFNDAGMYTKYSCCGHEKTAGYIFFHDGRIMLLLPDVKYAQDIHDKLFEMGIEKI